MARVKHSQERYGNVLDGQWYSAKQFLIYVGLAKFLSSKPPSAARDLMLWVHIVNYACAVRNLRQLNTLLR